MLGLPHTFRCRPWLVELFFLYPVLMRDGARTIPYTPFESVFSNTTYMVDTEDETNCSNKRVNLALIA